MTIQDIITRLFTDKGVTNVRVEKAQGFAVRNQLEWSAVLAAMTDAQRKQVEDAR